MAGLIVIFAIYRSTRKLSFWSESSFKRPQAFFIYEAIWNVRRNDSPTRPIACESLDTIDNTARRVFTRAIYQDSLIRIKNLKDSTKRIIVLNDLRQGEYRIKFNYEVDSLDNHISRKVVVWFERADSTQVGRQQFMLRKAMKPEEFSRLVTADKEAVRMVVDLLQAEEPISAENTKKKKKQHTGFTVTDLKIIHTPTVEEAVDSLYAKQLVVKIFADEFFTLFDAQDSLASGAVALRDSI